MSNTESFLIVDDLVGLNEVIDFEKVAKLVSEYNQTNAHQQNARIYSFSMTFNLEETKKKCKPFWETITSNEDAER